MLEKVLFCTIHGPMPGKFCSKCGALLIERWIPIPDADYSIAGLEKCKCGYDLKHEHQSFCPGCGHELKWMCR